MLNQTRKRALCEIFLMKHMTFNAWGKPTVVCFKKLLLKPFAVYFLILFFFQPFAAERKNRSFFFFFKRDRGQGLQYFENKFSFSSRGALYKRRRRYVIDKYFFLNE